MSLTSMEPMIWNKNLENAFIFVGRHVVLWDFDSCPTLTVSGTDEAVCRILDVLWLHGAVNPVIYLFYTLNDYMFPSRNAVATQLRRVIPNFGVDIRCITRDLDRQDVRKEINFRARNTMSCSPGGVILIISGDQAVVEWVETSVTSTEWLRIHACPVISSNYGGVAKPVVIPSYHWDISVGITGVNI